MLFQALKDIVLIPFLSRIDLWVNLGEIALHHRQYSCISLDVKTKILKKGCPIGGWAVM